MILSLLQSRRLVIFNNSCTVNVQELKVICKVLKFDHIHGTCTYFKGTMYNCRYTLYTDFSEVQTEHTWQVLIQQLEKQVYNYLDLIM